MFYYFKPLIMKASVSLKLTILMLQTDQFKIHIAISQIQGQKQKSKTASYTCSVIVKFILTRQLFLCTIEQYYDANLRLA